MAVSTTRRRRSVVGRASGVVLEAAAAFLLWLCGWLALWVLVPTLVVGLVPVMVTSGSMGPVIAPGDVVLLREPPDEGAGALGAGTVITFRQDGREGLVTHRIEAVRDDGRYRTRGDANTSPDSTPVARADVVGVGTLLVPFVGLPRLWWEQRSPVLAACVVLVLAALAVVRAAPAGQAARPRDGVDVTPDASGTVAPHGIGASPFAGWLVALPGWAIPVAAGTTALLLVVLWSGA